MVYFLLIVGVIFLVIALMLWVKFVFLIFKKLSKIIFKNKIKEENNPYIQTQKLVIKNDNNYDDYLKWMILNSSGVPLDKIMTKEEFKAGKEINKML
jgi:hypothetical protein